MVSAQTMPLLTHNLPLLHPDSVRHARAASVRAGSPRAAARPGPADEEARSARATQAGEVGYGDSALLDAAKKGNLGRVQKLLTPENVNCRDSQVSKI